MKNVKHLQTPSSPDGLYEARQQGLHSKLMTFALMIALFVFLLFQVNLLLKVGSAGAANTEQPAGIIEKP